VVDEEELVLVDEELVLVDEVLVDDEVLVLVDDVLVDEVEEPPAAPPVPSSSSSSSRVAAVAQAAMTARLTIPAHTTERLSNECWVPMVGSPEPVEGWRLPLGTPRLLYYTLIGRRPSWPPGQPTALAR